ncbi:hypothetical protein Tco_1010482, partial [Tanacetum coccineum]
MHDLCSRGPKACYTCYTSSLYVPTVNNEEWRGLALRRSVIKSVHLRGKVLYDAPGVLRCQSYGKEFDTWRGGVILNITSNTTTGNGIVDWSNDDLARVKGKEKGDYTRCVRPNIRLPRSKRSRVAQVLILKARINELEVEMKDLKERQHIEMKEMKKTKLEYMAKYKNHNLNEDFSNVLNTTNTEVANDSSIIHNPGPYGNSTSTRA